MTPTPADPPRSGRPDGPGGSAVEDLLRDVRATLGPAPVEAPWPPATGEPRQDLVTLLADAADRAARSGSDLPELPAGALRLAVRTLLDRLVAKAPGRSVEVRVPPYAAVQCVEGPRHTRGTPPNVVETEPTTWLRLATGRLAWAEAVDDGRVRASGPRADLTEHLPVG